jgi:CRP/FNR family transcriptional regulator, cyclic AMP receptor protein
LRDADQALPAPPQSSANQSQGATQGISPAVFKIAHLSNLHKWHHSEQVVFGRVEMRDFNVNDFLATLGEGRIITTFTKKEIIYAQGTLCDAVFYLIQGKVILNVLSTLGKEATIAILGEGAFFEEGCIAGQSLRMASATALTDCKVMRIENRAMVLALHRDHRLSEMFVAYLLGRNIRYEEDLVDQLFNSSEKRLARILLLLAQFGKEGKPERVVPKISQETLAEMVGTTRSRVNFFMNRFRKLGFIHYNGELEVHSSLLNVVLHDSPRQEGSSKRPRGAKAS